MCIRDSYSNYVSMRFLQVMVSYLANVACLPGGLYANVFLARSAKLLEGLYILRMFFLYFFINFLVVAPGAPWLRSQWTDHHQNFRIGRQVKGLDNTIELFLIFQGTLPWQPIKVEKSAFFPDQSTLSHCHSETNCNITIPISNRSPQ